MARCPPRQGPHLPEHRHAEPASRDSLDRPTKFWLNGQEAGGVSLLQPGVLDPWLPIDVTGLAQGRQKFQIVVRAQAIISGGPEGSLFLGSKPMESYPFSDTHLNARYFEWYEYVGHCIAEKMENTYKVDPRHRSKPSHQDDGRGR
jgi:hypothetical protein